MKDYVFVSSDMLKTYLLDKFVLGSVKVPATWIVDEISVERFCENIKEAQRYGELENYISSDNVVELVNTLCGTGFKANKSGLEIEPVVKLLVVSVSERLKEGKVITAKELQEMVEQKKIKIYKVVVV